MVVAAFIMILNETIVSIAIPHLAKTLNVSAGTAQWLVSGFLVTMAVVIPTTGFLIDRFAPRHIFLTAVTTFAFVTGLCVFGTDFVALLAGRGVLASVNALLLSLVISYLILFLPAIR